MELTRAHRSAGWGVQPLGEVSHIKTGSRNNQDKVEGGTYPFFVRSQTVERINTYSYDCEAILVPGEGGIGSIFHYIDGKFEVHQRVYKISDFSDEAVGKYIYYYMLARFGNHAMRNSVKATVDSLRLPTFKEFEISLPPVSEQRAIAAALSDVDALLAALDRLIAKKRAVKTAAMQQLLTGRQRLPGFSDGGYQETEVGSVPTDWRIAALHTLVDPQRHIRYGIVQPGDYDVNGRFMIRGQDYSEAKGWASPSAVFRVSAKVEEKYRSARVKAGDLIMTIVGYCGHVETVPQWLDGANLTQTTARIAIDSDMAVPAFVKYLLKSPVGQKQVDRYLKGAAQPGLNCGDVEQFLILLPSQKEQEAIATVLSDMDAEVAALEARRNKTQQIKQGMMQELLTGRTRLVQPAPESEPTEPTSEDQQELFA